MNEIYCTWFDSTKSGRIDGDLGTHTVFCGSYDSFLEQVERYRKALDYAITVHHAQHVGKIKIYFLEA